MPKSKFEIIYKEVKQKIESLEYDYQELLPSEHNLSAAYMCSRNTIRRALGELIEDGYVQSLPGKGVRVIYQPVKQTSFIIGGIESFKESATRNLKIPNTKVIQFTDLIADERIHARTGFPIGSELYYIQRVRYLDGKALILDINMFLKSVVTNLTPEIAQASIYDYLENILGVQIITSKRKVTSEHASPLDEKHLDLKDYNFLSVITSQTFDSNGVMFEFTQSRHRPDYFCFLDTAIRKR